MDVRLYTAVTSALLRLFILLSSASTLEFYRLSYDFSAPMCRKKTEILSKYFLLYNKKVHNNPHTLSIIFDIELPMFNDLLRHFLLLYTIASTHLPSFSGNFI